MARLQRIDRMLNERRCVPVDAFLVELGISIATFKRDLQYLRDRLYAPIVWDPLLRGYRYDRSSGAGQQYVLPGIWYNASELHALLAIQQILAAVRPGLLEPHVEPWLARIRGLLDSGEWTGEEVQRRVRVHGIAGAGTMDRHFEAVVHAVLARRRLRLLDDESGSWVVSPQRLVFHEGGWQLDAWRHAPRGGDRHTEHGPCRIALRRLSRVTVLDHKAREVSERTLDRELGKDGEPAGRVRRR